MPRTCVICQAKLRGRSDQRFCSDYCRNRYHNQRKKQEYSFFRKVNQTLRKNRSILYHLANNYQLRLSIEELLAFGFDFQYCTAQHQDQQKGTVFYCYDMAYLKAEGMIIILPATYSARTIPVSSES